jgi:hypothetical protein
MTGYVMEEYLPNLLIVIHFWDLRSGVLFFSLMFSNFYSVTPVYDIIQNIF